MSTTTHNCIIAVSEEGDAMLVLSVPSLIESRQFDGPFLSENITPPNPFPKEPGVYRCVIICKYTKAFDHYSGGVEYDEDIYVENVVKLELSPC